MDTWVIVAIIAAAVLIVIVALATWMYMRSRRTGELRETFGPEYERTVGERGRGAGEQELLERRERVSRIDVRPLSEPEHERFTAAWTSTQAKFVDDPSIAISEADDLVTEVMRTRGYPVEDDFERRVGDVSVDHPGMVENYRSAHSTAVRHRRGDATTEELRRAMVNYRALFEELLETGDPGQQERLVPRAERQ